uniref:non-specific serine/threonine protein kinase n=1 Tax=Lactuca sativa TaxID=4236 RepID=A0A9R1WPR3_LACSA|nr:hypothetical protein LSAT_V11C900498670 [Lactuca sativa]
MLELNMRFRLVALFFLSSIHLCSLVQSICSRGCGLALGSYYISPGNELDPISQYMNTNINSILQYNRGTITNQDSVQSFIRINVPFSCECINGDFLGHMFSYTVRSQDTYGLIASERYANLTTVEWIQRFNSHPVNRIPDVNTTINVTVNCSCGDSSISKDYGLFVTYTLRSGETLDSVSSVAKLSSNLMRSYNPDANFDVVNSLIYIPGRGLSGGAIGGIAVAVVAGVLLLAGCSYYGFYRNKKDSSDLPIDAPHILTGITVDKSIEFSYKELSKATDEFSLANKIGQGGFGAVYYAKLRGQKVAIKKMDMQASREFLAELKVLTQVHHLNLVRLIGYSVEGSLFLVYEYLENGNLSEHLHLIGRDPLPWSTRVQIALDSARGLEYIHEHIVPIYIHRDIKSANILIDKNFNAKVADFGLAKLVEVGNKSLHTRLVGTFGYMPPERYAKRGNVSPKVDVYAFGVVLYELISAKEAVVKTHGSTAKGLVSLCDEVLSKLDPKDGLVKMIDPRLGDNYPLDSVCKMAELAKACTHENPQLRPSMRSIMVELMTISSSMEDGNVGSFYEN